MQHSNLSPAADEVEPVYSTPHGHAAAEPIKVGNLHWLTIIIPTHVCIYAGEEFTSLC